MAVNRVVESAVQDGKIDVVGGTGPDGVWTDKIRVNNSPPDNVIVLPRPTVDADRHSDSNRGRTGIALEWKVADSDTNTMYRVETSDDRIDWEVLPTVGVANFVSPEDLTSAVVPAAVVGAHIDLTARNQALLPGVCGSTDWRGYRRHIV